MAMVMLSAVSRAGISASSRSDALISSRTTGIAATNAKLDALGLLLDSDPRRVTKTGSAQSSDPANDPATDDTTADADNDPAQADQ